VTHLATPTPHDHGEDLTSGHVHYPVLDSIRFVGALMVLTTHAAFWAGAYPRHGPLGPLFARMDVGVAIFFVLSGFLLSRPWLLAAAEQSSAPRLGRYYARRVVRIFPVYLVVAVAALAFVHANRGLGPADWLGTLGLADIYLNDGPPSGLTQTWSLATELSFYAVLPLLMLVGVGRLRALSAKRVLALVCACAVTSVAWLALAPPRIQLTPQRPLNEWLPALLIWFAAGILLALATVLPSTSRLRSALRGLGRLPGVCWTLAASLLLVAATPLAGPTLLEAPTSTEVIAKNLLYTVVGLLIVLTGVFPDPRSAYARFMSAPVPRHLGYISYGIFCVHLPLLHLIMWTTGYELFVGHLPQIWLLTLCLSIAAAEALYRVVERPAMSLVTRRRAPTAQPSNSPTEASTR